MRLVRGLSLLCASALVHGACSAEERTGAAEPAREWAALTQPVSQSPPERVTDAGTGAAMTQQRIVISSDLGRLTAELEDNPASRALVAMLPLRIEMHDHLRQEKTGVLPSPLPELPRQSAFSAGTLGLWGSDDFVIYYRSGRVPQPGINVLGRVTGDVSILDRPGPLTVSIEFDD